jgi:hypothetical protein
MITINQRCHDLLVSIKANGNEFDFAFAGADREYLSFLYRDQEIEFYFSTDHEIGSTVLIKSIRKQRDSGPFVTIPISMRERIISNIEELFMTRLFYDPGRPIDATYNGIIPSKIQFDWN